MTRSGQPAAQPEAMIGSAKLQRGCFAHDCPVCSSSAGAPCRTRGGAICRTHIQRRRLR